GTQQAGVCHKDKGQRGQGGEQAEDDGGGCTADPVGYQRHDETPDGGAHTEGGQGETHGTGRPAADIGELQGTEDLQGDQVDHESGEHHDGQEHIAVTQHLTQTTLVIWVGVVYGLGGDGLGFPHDLPDDKGHDQAGDDGEEEGGAPVEDVGQSDDDD